MNTKIQNDLKELVFEQVISPDTAARIEAYYQSKKVDAPNRLFTIFGVLGALLVGLGIILILAHNWDDFSRTTKTFLAFLPLVIGQGFVGFSIFKRKGAVWKEASGTFLFFAVGSCISLISQIYNIPGKFSSFLLTWILLCAPLIYLLRSQALAVLHVVFMTYYAADLGYSFSFTEKTPWLYILLLVIVLPHYLQLLRRRINANITSIFNWLVPLSLTIILGTFIQENEEFGILIYVVLFGLFYNLGKMPWFGNGKLRRNGFLVLGSLGTIYMLLLTSFDWIWEDIIREPLMLNSQEFYVVSFLMLITLGVLGYSISKKWMEPINISHYVFLIFAVVFLIGTTNDFIPLVLINLLVLIIALITIKIGADKFHFGILNYGLFIIAILIVCRFFDTDMSFVVRGLLFVGVGLGFFFTNYLMLKKQKERNINLKK